jgi:hypothetical protein
VCVWVCGGGGGVEHASRARASVYVRQAPRWRARASPSGGGGERTSRATQARCCGHGWLCTVTVPCAWTFEVLRLAARDRALAPRLTASSETFAIVELMVTAVCSTHAQWQALCPGLSC